MAQVDGIGANRCAVDRGGRGPFHQRHHIAVGALGDGRHRHAGFADGGHHLDQRDLATGGGARHHLDGRIAHRGGRVDGTLRWLRGVDHSRPFGSGGLRSTVVDELDLVLPDFDGIAILQLLLLDRLAVDVRAVGAVEVFNEDVAAGHLQHGVLTADGEVVDHDVVVGPATEGGAVLGELHLLDHDTVDGNDHFRHGRLLWNPAALV